MSKARDELLAKALAYYAEHGVRDTSLRTLAAAIGTSQRMLHYHFGAREDLLAAVVEALVDADSALVAELFADEPDPFVAAAALWAHVSERGRTFGPLFFELSAHAMHGLPHAQSLGEALVARTEAAFAAAYRPHVADDATARRLARLAVGAGRGLLFAALIDGDHAASDEAVELLAVLVRHELKG